MNTAEIKPSIAAVVACHNYGRYLAVCLESLLAQTLPFREIIVVDDSSDDDTAAVAARYGSRITYLKTDFKSVQRSHQAGVELASSELIVPVDADDWLNPDFNQRMAAALAADSSAGFSYCGYYYHFETEEDAARGPHYEAPLLPFDAAHLARVSYVSSCSMVRKSAWLGEDPAMTRYCDWDHWLRIAVNGWKGVLVPERLFYYRIHSNSESIQTHDWKEELKKTVIERYAGRFDDRQRSLTILTCFSGKKRILPQFLESLAALRKPADTQLLFIDNSYDREFNRALHAVNPLTLWYPRRLELPETGEDHKAVCLAIARHCAALYNYAVKYAQGRQILILEDDVLVPPDALEKLSRLMCAKRADFAAGITISRLTGKYHAWRLRGELEEAGVYYVPVGRQPKRVFASAFGCLLTDGRALQRMRFCAEKPEFAFYGCDMFAGLWAREQNLRWFVHGGVRCRHLDQDGRPVRLGHDIRRNEDLVASLVPEDREKRWTKVIV